MPLDNAPHDPSTPDPPRLDVVYTRAEYHAFAEQEARKMLGVSLEDALAKLDRGELDGTLNEARLKLIRRLL